MRIERLTPEQTARMAEYAERWTAIGLSTEPANRATAEDGVRLAYEAAGLKPPERIVWTTSPLATGLTRAILIDSSVWDSVWASVRASVGASVGASVRDSVLASVRASVGASVRDSVWDSVLDSVWDSVLDSVWASVWDSVRASVWDSVGASVGASVRDSVLASVRASVGASVRDSAYGQHDAHWLAFYQFFHDICGLRTETQKIQGLWQIAESANWWLPHEHICWISERPTAIHFDLENRLHNASGPALVYPDGWGIYRWHGTPVPADIIEQPDTLTVARIDDERNIEVQRAMLEIYGEGRYLEDSGTTPIAQDAYGTLYQRDFNNGDEPLVMVRVENSTPEPDGTRRAYWLPVDPDGYNGDAGRIPQAAVAWTWRWGTNGELVYKDWRDYRPVAES